MSRSEIIKKLKEKNPKLDKSQLEEILEIFCYSIQRSLKKGIKFEIRGFGTFFSKKIKLSVKAAQIDEEKSLIAKFGEGATKSGATLKGIFENAIGKKGKKEK